MSAKAGPALHTDSGTSASSPRRKRTCCTAWPETARWWPCTIRKETSLLVCFLPGSRKCIQKAKDPRLIGVPCHADNSFASTTMSNQLVPPWPGKQVSPAEASSAEERQLFPVHRSWTIATIVAVVAWCCWPCWAWPWPDNRLRFLPTGSLGQVCGYHRISTAWLHAGPGRPLSRGAVVRRVLHWLGIGVALELDFLVRRSGKKRASLPTWYALLVLALGCYLAGVHLEWMFAVVGVLLTLTLVIVVEADQYLWLIFVAGGITIAAMLVVRWMLHKSSAAKSGPNVARDRPGKGVNPCRKLPRGWTMSTNDENRAPRGAASSRTTEASMGLLKKLGIWVPVPVVLSTWPGTSSSRLS